MATLDASSDPACRRAATLLRVCTSVEFDLTELSTDGALGLLRAWRSEIGTSAPAETSRALQREPKGLPADATA